MNIKFLKMVSFLAVMVSLVACHDHHSIPAPATTVVAGTASAFTENSTVQFYVVEANGDKGALLVEGLVDADGVYSVDLGPFAGTVLIEVSGSYADPSTGLVETIDPTQPIRTVLAVTPGMNWAAVTLLTEIAVQTAEGSPEGLTNAGIDAANVLVSALFGLDILKIQPPLADAVSFAAATDAEIKSTLVLETLHQMAAAGGIPLVDLVASLSQELIVDGFFSQGTLDDLALALADYLDPANTGNLTGLTVADVPALAGIGRVPFTFTLTLSGTPVAPALEAVQLSLELPAGVRIAEDSSGPLVEILGSALSVDTLLTANYVPETGLLPGELTLALLVPAGLTEGDILRVSASALGATPPQIPDFSVFIDSAKDGNGADLVLGGAAVSALVP